MFSTCPKTDCNILVVFNPFLYDRALDRSKLKLLADNKIKCYQKIEICFSKGRKHCGKRGKCC